MTIEKEVEPNQDSDVVGSARLGWTPDLSDGAATRIAGAVTSSRAPGAGRVYASDWRRFRNWCETHAHHALPAHPVMPRTWSTPPTPLMVRENKRIRHPH